MDAASNTGKIAEAIQRVIRGLPINPALTNVAIRKQLRINDSDGERVCLIAVAESETFEPLGVGDAIGKLLWACKRPCGVALGYASGGLQGDNPDLRQARVQIEDAVTMQALQRAGLVGPAVSANDVMQSGRMIFDMGTTPGTDWSVFLFGVETLEQKPC